MSWRAHAVVAALLVLALASPVRAYSVLAHEANVDALWDRAIRPLLLQRYPHATADELLHARAFAYGGSVIQDLGYYPFGSRFFSNLLHYVRSGDFVATMVRDARTLDEYAFAIGALGHYAADNAGHPEGVNRAVALMFPKLQRKYGASVTYAESPASHVIVEFSFDIVQAAAGAYAPDAYHRFIGFEVAPDLLERAFRETYGLEMREVFGDEERAIGSYRHAVSETIPAITRAAWRDKHEEIAQLAPQIRQQQFVFNLTRQQYEHEYGVDYQRPRLVTRILVLLYRLLPKIGPLKPLKFQAPPREAEQFFLASFKDTRERYAATLAALRRGQLELPNTDFDTGRPSVHGEYGLADKTYAELLDRLASRKFEAVPPRLRRNILAYYEAPTAHVATRNEEKRMVKIRKRLSELTDR